MVRDLIDDLTHGTPDALDHAFQVAISLTGELQRTLAFAQVVPRLVEQGRRADAEAAVARLTATDRATQGRQRVRAARAVHGQASADVARDAPRWQAELLADEVAGSADPAAAAGRALAVSTQVADERRLVDGSSRPAHVSWRRPGLSTRPWRRPRHCDLGDGWRRSSRCSPRRRARRRGRQSKRSLRSSTTHASGQGCCSPCPRRRLTRPPGAGSWCPSAADSRPLVAGRAGGPARFTERRARPECAGARSRLMRRGRRGRQRTCPGDGAGVEACSGGSRPHGRPRPRCPRIPRRPRTRGVRDCPGSAGSARRGGRPAVGDRGRPVARLRRLLGGRPPRVGRTRRAGPRAGRRVVGTVPHRGADPQPFGDAHAGGRAGRVGARGRDRGPRAARHGVDRGAQGRVGGPEPGAWSDRPETLPRGG